MAEHKFTPGPWYADKAGTVVWGGSGVRLTVADTKCCGSLTRDEDMANAVFIASAPELLSALEACKVAFRCTLTVRGLPCGECDACKAHELATVAIAKATGG